MTEGTVRIRPTILYSSGRGLSGYGPLGPTPTTEIFAPDCTDTSPILHRLGLIFRKRS
jgi:hypothetical protein